MFVRIIRDPALSTEVSIRVFMNLCKSPLLKMCKMASFPGKVKSTAHHTHKREGWGEQSSLVFKATWTKKQLDEDREHKT